MMLYFELQKYVIEIQNFEQGDIISIAKGEVSRYVMVEDASC